MWLIAAGFWAGAVALMAIAHARRDGSLREGARVAIDYLAIMMPRMLLALALAAFVAELLPSETVSRWLGAASGLQGILIASVAGIAVPAGGIVAFPLALAMLKIGVGVPQLVAFLTAWEVFAIHRVLAFEIPFLGLRFATLRLTASFALAPVAGLTAAALQQLLPV